MLELGRTLRLYGMVKLKVKVEYGETRLPSLCGE